MHILQFILLLTFYNLSIPSNLKSGLIVRYDDCPQTIKVLLCTVTRSSAGFGLYEIPSSLKKKKKIYCVAVPEEWFCLVLVKTLFLTPNSGFQNLGYKIWIQPFLSDPPWGVHNENDREIQFSLSFEFCFIDLWLRQACSEYDIDKLMYQKHTILRFSKEMVSIICISLIFQMKILFWKGLLYALVVWMIKWSSSSMLFVSTD